MVHGAFDALGILNVTSWIKKGCAKIYMFIDRRFYSCLVVIWIFKQFLKQLINDEEKR